MSRLVLLVCAFLFTQISIAQDDPLFRSEGFSTLWQNPATYGTKNKMEFNLAGQAIIPSLSSHYSMLLNGAYQVDFKKSDKISFGTGFSFVHDGHQYSHSNMFAVPLNVQYHFSRFSVSVGVTPGIHYAAFHSNFTPYPTTDYYNLYNGSETEFTLAAGINVFTENFYAAFSVNHLTAERFDKLGYPTTQHFAVQGGYRIALGKFGLFPMMSWDFTGGFHNLGGWLYFQLPKEYLSIGAGYEMNNGVKFSLRGKYKNFALAGIAQYQVSKLTTFGNWVTYEARFSYLLPSFDKNPDPSEK